MWVGVHTCACLHVDWWVWMLTGVWDHCTGPPGLARLPEPLAPVGHLAVGRDQSP